MSRYTSGREPFECLEFDQDFCTLTFGIGDCPAVMTKPGDRKCFNTIGTCSALSAYTAGVRTLRFCNARQLLPRDGNIYFPFLVSASIKPCTINPGGGDRNSSPLGTRATISAKLTDHPHSGNYVDKYAEERLTGAAQFDGIGYDPFQIATFWTKWKARNQYYLNRSMRHISGYIENGQIVDAVTRHFIVTGFSGPDSKGSVSINGSDILTKAQNDKAQAPVASSGKLLADISAGAGAFTATPAGVGDGEYPASGWVRVGDEIFTFTRSGDVFTVAGNQFNTGLSDHSEGDTIQLCLRIDSLRPDEILYILLHDYAGIDAAYLDTVQWDEESTEYLPRLYSTIITEPTGVAELVGEICEQMYFYTWFDERTNLVKMRAVRPADGETVTSLNDDSILADSVSLSDQPGQLITRVVLNYALRNPAVGLDEPSNYAVTDIFASLDEEGEDRGRGIKIKTINSRWLQAASGAAAIDLGNKLLARYKTPPRQVNFSLDAKDRDLWVGDFISISTRQSVNDIGERVPINAQIMNASEASPGSVFSYSSQQFLYELPPNPTDKPIDIAGDVYDFNLYDEFVSQYGSPGPTDNIVVTIRSGVVIGATSTSLYAFTIDDRFPVGVTITVNVYGICAGHGGDGGDGGVVYFSGGSLISIPGTDGEDGGPCWLVERPVSVNNNGIIGSGGGGSGGGGSARKVSGVSQFVYGGGGAGAGAGQIAGARGVRLSPTVTGGTFYRGSNGYDGALLIGGAGGAAGTDGSNRGGRGYAGGGLGQDGVSGQTASAGSANYVSPGAAGSAGVAIDGVSFITWINKGDVRGPEIG